MVDALIMFYQCDCFVYVPKNEVENNCMHLQLIGDNDRDRLKDTANYATAFE